MAASAGASIKIFFRPVYPRTNPESTIIRLTHGLPRLLVAVAHSHLEHMAMLPCLAMAAAFAASATAAAKTPNFMVLFLDDHGWGDVGANNPETTETPHMDKLAAGGNSQLPDHCQPAWPSPLRPD